jgi:hypothetical protein
MQTTDRFMLASRQTDIATFLFASAILVLGYCPATARERIESFRVAGATQTVALGLNDGDVVTGGCADKKGIHGFIRTADGAVTKFDAPGSGRQGVTVAYAINNSGIVAGAFTDATGVQDGFVRASDGTITEFVVVESFDTYIDGINAAGMIVGTYGAFNGPQNAYLRTADGTITEFAPPGSVDTTVGGVNDAGAIAGTYTDTSGAEHGYVRSPDGSFISFDDPAAGTVTTANAINNRGMVAGLFWDANGAAHGFVRSVPGQFTNFDLPGETISRVAGINKQGATAGTYGNDEGGFLRAPDGTVSTFVPRGTGRPPINAPIGINAKNSVAGWYMDKSAVERSYLIRDW